MKDLLAGEYALRKICSRDYEFTIPYYQQPFAWAKEHVLLFNERTPVVIEARQTNLLAVLHKKWELN